MIGQRNDRSGPPTYIAGCGHLGWIAGAALCGDCQRGGCSASPSNVSPPPAPAPGQRWLRALFVLAAIPAVTGSVVVLALSSILLVTAGPVLVLGLAVWFTWTRSLAFRCVAFGFAVVLAAVGWSEAWSLLADHVRGVRP